MASMGKAVYKRIVLKLSGEALPVIAASVSTQMCCVI